jgi:hypothetical protein
MRGVVVAGLDDVGAIAWQRLYMEPVEQNDPSIDEVVQKLSTPSR